MELSRARGPATAAMMGATTCSGEPPAGILSRAARSMRSRLQRRLVTLVACAALLPLGCGAPPERGALAESTDCAEPPLGAVRVLRELRIADARIDEPSAIQADLNGGVWVLDPASKAVAHFDREGRVVAIVSATGPAPWELSAPQAIGSDSNGGVWISDASRGRLVRFSSSGEYIDEISTPAAISAVSVARSGTHLFLSQRVLAGGGTTRSFVRRLSASQDSIPVTYIDSVTSDRIADAPFFGAPMIESVVAARPSGGIVTAYNVAYRLRFFSDSGTLEREVIGCEGSNSNEKNLKDASLERGMSFKVFVSTMQFDSSGMLTVALTTPQRGFHRLDVFDEAGNHVRSMRVPSRSSGGVFITGLVPGPEVGTFWALDHIDSQIRLIELVWPADSATRSE